MLNLVFPQQQQKKMPNLVLIFKNNNRYLSHWYFFINQLIYCIDGRPFTCSGCDFYIRSSSVEMLYKKFSLEKNVCHKTYTVVLGHYNDTELI